MPVLVCLSGLPGVGKSTIARALAARTGALWLRVDRVEQAMRDSHMVTDDLADGGYAALQAVSAAALEQGLDVIADCVNPIPMTRSAWQAASRSVDARHLDVELLCSDVRVHRTRVETRVPEVPGLALPAWAAVVARVYVPFATADLRLDTARVSVAEAVAQVSRTLERADG